MFDSLKTALFPPPFLEGIWTYKKMPDLFKSQNTPAF